MLKVFISQPMANKTVEEIKKEREEAVKDIKKLLNGDEFEVIDTILHDENLTSLQCLGKSIEMLSDADYVYFMDGFESARGCIVEFVCSVKYDKKILNGSKVCFQCSK